MTEKRISAGRYSVLVIDMLHYDAESETILHGFPNADIAREYARRRTRDSLEELRHDGQSAKELRRQWLLFGEDCCVIGQSYCGASEVEYFIAHPASAAERDWQGIEKSIAQ